MVALAQILAGHFSLSQPGMQIMPPTTGTPRFSDLPTALYICMVTRSGRFYATYFRSTKVTTIQIPYFLNNILPREEVVESGNLTYGIRTYSF